MNSDELRDELVDRITGIIVSHNLPDYASNCKSCSKKLYAEGGGRTLSRHRAERIVDDLGLVALFAADLTSKEISNAIAETAPRQPETG